MKQSKTPQERLASFKKANKVARERIAKKESFVSAEKYLTFLNSAAAIKSKKGNIKKEDKKVVIKGLDSTSGQVKHSIHNVHILDASGSMQGGKLTNAIVGINEEIRKLKEDNTVNYTQTIVSFSYSYDIKTHYYKVPMEKVEPFNCQVRGYTALYQAIGETLENLAIESNGTDKVLVKIFTDGVENASQGKYKSTSILTKLIKQCEEKGFTVTFVGTADDVNRVQHNLSIDDSNTLVHDNTAAGVAASFNTSTVNTMLFSMDVKAGKDVTRGFYKKKGTLDGK